MTVKPSPPLVRFLGLKIAYSWKCNALCAHCAVSAGPRMTERIDRDLALGCIDDAASLGLSTLQLTGGEVFLFYRDILRFLQRASELGMTSAIDTNAFWAKTPELAYRRLRTLRDLGLKRIVLSTDSWHQHFIALACVLAALEAARALRIEASVTVCALAGDPGLLETVWLLRDRGFAVQIQRVAPVGRATDLPRERMLRCSYEAAATPCGALHFPTVGPDGRVTLCCAPPLRFPLPVARDSPLILGWVDRRCLRTILLQAQRDPLLSLLAAGGVRALIDRLRHSDPDLAPPHADGYFGRCDLCTQLLTSPVWLARLRQAFPAAPEGLHPGGTP